MPSLASHPEDRSASRLLAKIHWGVFVSAILLAMIGLATVHSAGLELSTDYLPRQAAWIAIGLVAFFIVIGVDYQFLTTFAVPIYLASLVSLVLVLTTGQQIGGARSWWTIGTIGLQPSELAKLTTAILLARYLSTINRAYLELREIAVTLVIVSLPMGLMALQPDLGGAAMFVPMVAGMLLVAGVRLRWIVIGLVVALVLGLFAWNFLLLDYQKERVETFFAPDRDPQGAGYQLRQSKIAVGSGQLLGKGYMQGTQSQLRFLPALHTDFIFAVLAEEWGFLGVLVVLGLYAYYVFSAAEVATRARDRAGILLVVGLVSGFAFHVIYNTAMVVGLLPITGIPLPFLSYGGSFTLANFIAAGLILGIDFRRHVNR